MAEQEDLEFNTFFLTLKKKFAKLYKRVQEQCLLVFVPVQSALPSDLVYTQALFERHIFQASPLFHGRFESIATKPQLVVAIADGVLTPHGGFKEKDDKPQVLFEELFYNASYKPYRIICIDRVLDTPKPISKSLKQQQQPQSQGDIQLYTPKTSIGDHHSFICSVVSHAGQAKIGDLVSMFVDSYVVVPGYLDHLRSRVHELCNECTDVALQHAQGLSMQEELRVRQALGESTECFVFAQV